MINICMTREGWKTKPSSVRQWKDWTDKLGNPVSEYKYQSMTIAKNPVTISPFDFVVKLQQGYAWVGATFYRDSNGIVRRRLSEWKNQQIIAADLDNGDISPEKAYEIAYHEGWDPAIIHHTFSSTDKNPKLRVIFLLKEPVEEIEVIQSIWMKVGKAFNSDCSASDIVKIYQGGKSDCLYHYDEKYMTVEQFGELPQLNFSSLPVIDLGELHNSIGNQNELLKKLPGWWQSVMKRILVDVRTILREPHKGHRIGNKIIWHREPALFTAGRLIGQCEHFYLNWAREYVTVFCQNLSIWQQWDRDAAEFDNILSKGLTWGRTHGIDFQSEYNQFLEKIKNEETERKQAS